MGEVKAASSCQLQWTYLNLDAEIVALKRSLGERKRGGGRVPTTPKYPLHGVAVVSPSLQQGSNGESPVPGAQVRIPALPHASCENAKCSLGASVSSPVKWGFITILLIIVPAVGVMERIQCIRVTEELGLAQS